MKKKIGIIAVIFIGLLTVIYGMIFRAKDAVAVSIIGGADGPTSVFLAGKVGDGISLTLIVVGVVILAIVLALFLHRKKRNQPRINRNEENVDL